MDVKSVGQNIKEIREKKKITQKRLAELSGRGESAISNYESEGTLPEGWWIGFRVTDPDVWDKVKSGEYPMFSIEGEAVREEVEETEE